MPATRLTHMYLQNRGSIKAPANAVKAIHSITIRPDMKDHPKVLGLVLQCSYYYFSLNCFQYLEFTRHYQHGGRSLIVCETTEYLRDRQM